MALVLALALAAEPRAEDFYDPELRCALGPGECRLVDFEAPAAGPPADGNITLDKLATDARDALDARAVASTLDVSGRDVSIEDARGNVTSGAVPAVTVADEGATQGTVGEVERFDCRGAGIACTVTGAEATLTVSGVDPEARARLDAAEEFEGVLRSRTPLATATRIVVGTANVAYSLGARILFTGPDFEITIVVAAVGEPDGRRTVTRDALAAAGRVARANAPLTAANGVEFRNAPDNNRYRLGVDSSGDLFFSADTTDTYAVSLDRFDVDTTPALQFGAGGDVALSLDAADDLIGDIRPGVVDVAALRIDAGTAVAGRFLAVNADATGLEGVTATAGAHGDVTAVVAGDGLTGGGTADAVTLAVDPGDGIELSGGKVVLKLDTTRATAAFSLSAAGLDLGPAGVVTDRIANDAVTEAKLAPAVAAELHTEAEIEGIVRRDEAQDAPDTLAAFTGVDMDNFSNLDFRTGAVGWRFSDFEYYADSDEVEIDLLHPGPSLTPVTPAQIAVLRPYHIRIGSTALAFAAAAARVPPPGNTSVSLLWTGVATQPYPGFLTSRAFGRSSQRQFSHTPLGWNRKRIPKLQIEHARPHSNNEHEPPRESRRVICLSQAAMTGSSSWLK